METCTASGRSSWKDEKQTQKQSANTGVTQVRSFSYSPFDPNKEITKHQTGAKNKKSKDKAKNKKASLGPSFFP